MSDAQDAGALHRSTEPVADLLTGIEAIASHLNVSRRRAYYLHESGELPTFKHLGKVCARRSALARHFAALEKAASRG